MDSELKKMIELAQSLQDRYAQHWMSLEDFVRRAEEEYYQLGFRVEVKVYTTDQPELYAFQFEPIERISGEFDPDQQVREVTADILETGDKGVISTKGMRPEDITG